MGFNNIDFLDIEFENPISLYDKDVIYINGGNPFELLFQIKHSGTDNILKDLVYRNITVVGVSAGALILGPDIDIVHYFTPQWNSRDLNDFSALNFTNTRIFPHYDRVDLFEDNVEDKLSNF